jgi:hypothetical protein
LTLDQIYFVTSTFGKNNHRRHAIRLVSPVACDGILGVFPAAGGRANIVLIPLPHRSILRAA